MHETAANQAAIGRVSRIAREQARLEPKRKRRAFSLGVTGFGYALMSTIHRSAPLAEQMTFLSRGRTPEQEVIALFKNQ